MGFNSIKNQIPKPIRLFLGKALLVFIVWKIIYGVFLNNSNHLDHLLTTHVAEVSTKFLNNIGVLDGFTTKRQMKEIIQNGAVHKWEVSQIFHHNNIVLNIADACNGLELMVLYIGFIICMPSSFLRKTIYIILGVIALDLLNIFRCMGLIYLREYFNAYFQFAHHYLFKATVYTATFAIWMLYSRKISLKNEVAPIG